MPTELENLCKNCEHHWRALHDVGQRFTEEGFQRIGRFFRRTTSGSAEYVFVDGIVHGTYEGTYHVVIPTAHADQFERIVENANETNGKKKSLPLGLIASTFALGLSFVYGVGNVTAHHFTADDIGACGLIAFLVGGTISRNNTSDRNIDVSQYLRDSQKSDLPYDYAIIRTVVAD
jgi:hypothetical protein